MSASSDIQWCDATWNPLAGCSKVTSGCTNCYALKMAWRQVNNPRSPWFASGIAEKVGGKVLWTGRVATNAAALGHPLKWKKPKRIFVNSMSDLFHDAVPPQFIIRVFDVMRRCPQHTFMILTKRPCNMRWFLSEFYSAPLPNVWVGVSVERGDKNWRLDILREVPAAVRFVSFEPLLGSVANCRLDGIDWAIAGCESGHGSRPFDEDWARQARDLAGVSGSAFFYKQKPGERPGSTIELPDLDGRVWAEFPGGAA